MNREKTKKVLPTPKFKVGDKIETKRGEKFKVLDVGPKWKPTGKGEFVFMTGKPFQYLVEQNGKNFWFPESLIK